MEEVAKMAAERDLQADADAEARAAMGSMELTTFNAAGKRHTIATLADASMAGLGLYLLPYTSSAQLAHFDPLTGSYVSTGG